MEIENQIEEEANVPLDNYSLTNFDEENFEITEAAIFDEMAGKGIHSVKFNHNDQYIAAGKK